MTVKGMLTLLLSHAECLRRLFAKFFELFTANDCAKIAANMHANLNAITAS